MPDEVLRYDTGPGQASAGRPRYRTAALAAAAVVLLAGVGIGGWFLLSRHNSAAQAANRQGTQQTGPVASQAGGGSPVGDGNQADGSPDPGASTASGPASGTPAPSQETPQAGPVSVATTMAGDAQAEPVAAFLDEYFNAINAHDYQAYVALLSPQAQSVTQAQFDTGYGSSTDSSETLHGISSGAGGDLIADVAFISNQSVAESATKSTCTKWDISLYLAPDGDSYLIDNPPADYHARYASCG